MASSHLRPGGGVAWPGYMGDGRKEGGKGSELELIIRRAFTFGGGPDDRQPSRVVSPVLNAKEPPLGPPESKSQIQMTLINILVESGIRKDALHATPLSARGAGLQDESSSVETKVQNVKSNSKRASKHKVEKRKESVVRAVGVCKEQE